MMMDTNARQPFGITEENTMNVHEQEDMMILGATIFGAMKNGAFVKDVLAVSFSSTNLLHKKDQII